MQEVTINNEKLGLELINEQRFMICRPVTNFHTMPWRKWFSMDISELLDKDEAIDTLKFEGVKKADAESFYNALLELTSK